MKIELDNYGLMFDSEWCYISLTWELIITTALLVTAYKIYKRKKNK